MGLRDYKRQLHWHGHWNHTLQKVTECQLELFNRPFAVYCLTPPGRQANLTDSGYVGMSAAVDFWSVRFDDHERKFFEDIHMGLEKGSTSIVMQERVFGEHFNETEQKLWKWVEHREWFDVKEDPIPDSVFAILKDVQDLLLINVSHPCHNSKRNKNILKIFFHPW